MTKKIFKQVISSVPINSTYVSLTVYCWDCLFQDLPILFSPPPLLFVLLLISYYGQYNSSITRLAIGTL